MKCTKCNVKLRRVDISRDSTKWRKVESCPNCHTIYDIMNTWDLWVQNWNNANKFFNSKGKVETRARLKKKWHDDFINMFEMFKR